MTGPRKPAAEAFAKQGTKAKAQRKDHLYRGISDELVRDPGPNPLTVWMLAWRCKRCGYCWPVRRTKRTTGALAGVYLKPRVMGRVPGEVPKKCPGCDSPKWHTDYYEPLRGGRRGGRRRKPSMLASWRDAHPKEDKQEEPEP